MGTPYILEPLTMPPAPRRVPVEEYLAAEAVAETRTEYLDGVLRSMPGGSPRHLVIESRLHTLTDNRLEGGGQGCFYFNGNAQIVIPGLRTYLYPDGAIACPPDFAKKPRGALTNPRVVFEVLSPLSTEGYDRGAKFRRYRAIESLEDYVLVSTSEPVVEVFSRPEWGLKSYEGLEAVAPIPSVGIELPLAELYALAMTVPE